MHKEKLRNLIIKKLNDDLAVVQKAAEAAHEAATHTESIAENKYDTFGLEASYLAEGQSKRVAELENAIATYKTIRFSDFDKHSTIKLTATAILESESSAGKMVFLGPDAGGLKLNNGENEIIIVTPDSPLGKALLGKSVDDLVTVGAGQNSVEFEIVDIE